jgi:hypothetical protein
VKFLFNIHKNTLNNLIIHDILSNWFYWRK